METVTDFFFSGSKITMDSDCSHEIKILTPWKKSYVNLDGILKSRDITLPTNTCIVKAMVFPVVIHGCESWTLKKAECWRIDAFKLWCWRRLLRVPWTARRPNQSILKEISPGCSLEGLTLKLKLQYFGHLIRTADSLEKTLMLGKIEGKKRRDNRGLDGWMDHWLNEQEFPQALGDGEGQEAWRAAVHGVAKSRPWLSNWTKTTLQHHHETWVSICGIQMELNKCSF